MNKPQCQMREYTHRCRESGLSTQQGKLTAEHPRSPASTAHKTLITESPLHEANSSSILPSPTELRIYQEYKKIYTVSHHLALQKNRQNALLEDLMKRLKNIENKLKEGKERDTPKDNLSQETKAKRSRRTAEEIEKHFKCEAQYCDRQYGSQGSLQQHIKLKHPELHSLREASLSSCLDNQSI